MLTEHLGCEGHANRVPKLVGDMLPGYLDYGDTWLTWYLGCGDMVSMVPGMWGTCCRVSGLWDMFPWYLICGGIFPRVPRLWVTCEPGTRIVETCYHGTMVVATCHSCTWVEGHSTRVHGLWGHVPLVTGWWGTCYPDTLIVGDVLAWYMGCDETVTLVPACGDMLSEYLGCGGRATCTRVPI